MVGCELKSPYNDVLFDNLLDGSRDNWLWFYLKLASFQFSTRLKGMNVRSQFPAYYKPYFMEDLVQKIVYELSRDALDDPQLSK